MATYPDKIDAWDGVALILAILLGLAPWLLGYAVDPRATGTSIVCALAIAACAVIAMTEFTRLFEEVDLAIGLATAVAPFVIGFAHDRRAVYAHLAIGGLVALLSAAELLMLRHRGPRLSD